MPAEPTNASSNIPAPEGQANPQATPATSGAPGAGEDPAALKAQLDAILKWKAAADADLAKLRAAKKEAEDKAAAERAAAEAKLREAGDFAKLHDAEKEKRVALEAQLADLAPRAEKLSAHEKRVQEKLAAAKAKGDLPSYIVRAIDVASLRDVDEALDILDEFRSQTSTASASKQPAPPAPALGAAPPSPNAPIDFARPSLSDLQNLKATDPEKFRALIGGGARSPLQTFASRITGAGRK